MKKILIIGLLASLSPGLAIAGETINRTVMVGAEPEVHLINARGDIIVVGEGSGEIRVRAKLVDAVERLDIKESDGQVRIEVVYKRKKKGGGWNSSGSTLYVSIPTDSMLHAEGVSSDVEVTGVRGKLYLNTVSGDVEAESWGGKLKVNTTSGDIDVRGHNNPAWNGLETVSGDITMIGLSGELRAVTVSGDIDAEDCMFDRVNAGVTSGDIDLSNALSSSAEVDAEAVSGEVMLSMASGWAGRVDISTLNGSIDNCFGPKPQRVSRYGPGRVLNFEHGNGRGRIEVETVNGDVEICID